MWVMTTRGAYSIIQWHDGSICVRARMPGDIDRLREVMPSLGPETLSPTKDYRYRAFTDRAGLTEGMAALAGTIDYGNFKSAVEKTNLPKRYAQGLHRIWSVMASWQPGGAYGHGGQGAVAVPAGEKKRAAAAKRAEEKSRTERRAEMSGVACEDCGVVRPDAEMDLYYGRWLCRDMKVCRPGLVGGDTTSFAKLS